MRFWVSLCLEGTEWVYEESEKRVNGIANKSTIVIAHRLSTVESADEIIVLKKGKIVEKAGNV